MLEGVLAWFINNYIGEYFDNVNTDQLSIVYGEGLFLVNKNDVLTLLLKI